MEKTGQQYTEQVRQAINTLAAAETSKVKMPATGSWQSSVHLFNAQQVCAIISAVAANRPLLVRGEPGLGKSQLARAAAAVLKRYFVPAVVQPDSEYTDLLWSIDHTRRLAEAQIAGHSGNTARLDDMNHYVGPGPLWWAFNWEDAQAHYKACKNNYSPPCEPEELNVADNGIVLLIDEIDKADISLANGLLEVLGNNAFAVPVLNKTVKPLGVPPLIVLTSNDIRELPAAMVRRCVVLELKLPENIEQYFFEIGSTHFPEMSPEVLQQAGKQILEDRKHCRELPKTGLAEYLDLLRALHQASAEAKQQLLWLQKLSCYFFKSQAVER